MRGKIIGIKYGVTKSGNNNQVIFLEREFEEWELKAGRCEGVKVDNVYVSNPYTNLKVGDNVLICTEARNFQGKSYTVVTNIIVENKK